MTASPKAPPDTRASDGRSSGGVALSEPALPSTTPSTKLMAPTEPVPSPPTNPAEKARWLANTLDASITYVRNKRTNFQTLSAKIHVGVFVLTGLISVALGVRWPAAEDALRNVALVMGAIATILASLDMFFNFRALWIEHEEAIWRFCRLRDALQFYLEGTPDSDVDPAAIDKYHKEYQNIWNSLSMNWLSLRRNAQLK